MSTLIEVEGRDPVRLTEAQIRGLAVVREHDERGGARVSNLTDGRTGSVYWQTAERLIELGLVAGDGAPLTSTGRLHIAPGGWAIVHALDDLAREAS